MTNNSSLDDLTADVKLEDNAIDAAIAKIAASRVTMTYIVVINQSTVISDADVQAMIPAFSTQWNRDLLPIWDINPATFSFIPKSTIPRDDAWWLVFLDDSDQAGALAYHDLTNTGQPISKIFAKTLLADKASISVGATHELVEMACDPMLNYGAQDASGVFWALENADPVESDEYGYKIGDVLVTDFVTPSWFGHQYAKAPFDFAGHTKSAFEVLSGGYAQKFDTTAGWVQVTGSKAKLFSKSMAAVGSRRERRTRQWKNWERSAAMF